MFDFAVKNGLIVDGSRQEPFWGNVYGKDGKIALVSTDASLPAAACVDVGGKMVSPGFIDMHSHSDCVFLSDPTHEGKLLGGVTFELTGQCGSSAIPVNARNRTETLQSVGAGFGVEFDTRRFTATDFASYGDAITQTGVSINQSCLIGHGTLRSHVMGYAMRALASNELATMCALLDAQLAQGAPGLSLGLIYPPGSFCDTEELLALAEVVARRDRMLAVHMRNENKGIFEALDEMVGVAKRTGVRLQISHLKLMGETQWGRSEELLHKLDLAKAQGVRIHCDQYPYTASHSGLTSCLPQRAMDGGLSMLEARLNDPAAWESIIKGGLPELQNRGGAENIVISDTAGRYPEIEGTGLKETASRLKLSVPEAIRRILLQCGGLVNCIYHAMSRDDMLRIMDRRDIAVVSDGTAYSLAHMIGTPHPRNTSSFPCFLRMVREEKRMSIADAIYKITALPATLMGLGDRIGLLKPGYAGDITVVDFDTVADTATYREPWLAPVGVECVLVNGELVLEKGVITAARPGKFYRAGCPA